MDENSKLKSIERLTFGRWYQSSLMVSADWIGGGHFEGQISRSYLRFINDSNVVELRSKILGIRFGNPKIGNLLLGNYFGDENGAIRVYYNGAEMLGFVLGPNNEYIAFDVKYENMSNRITIGYELVNQLSSTELFNE